MSEMNPLVSLGDLTKPATVLIEKIAEAVGGGFRPYQIKRVAKAEAEAEKIKALANIEITQIQQRALVRLIDEEGKKQENIEDITAQALPELKADAKPEDIENDWLANFFEKCKLISDREMQSLWARLLAGEANKPGTFSKRTVEFTHDMDKSDAQLFTNLCTFGWFSGQVFPLIFEPFTGTFWLTNSTRRPIQYELRFGTGAKSRSFIHRDARSNNGLQRTRR